ncbi:MAG TPA: hypothetical protein VMI75_06230 [Polyangiaceae bacterium]|nr:hypothetical protein [Polyangiaceae bacterium]
MAWWIAEKGSPAEWLGRTEVSEAAAKNGALALSIKNPQSCFQVRYHVNANGHTEVRWEAIDGKLFEIVGEDRRRT